MTPRDSQRSKVYRAERELPEGNYFPQITELQNYVDRIVLSRWFEKHYPSINAILVKDGRGRCSACGYNNRAFGYIKMPKWSRREIFILHEIAHVVTPEQYANHGREFVKNYIALIERWMKFNPRPVFREHRVKWHSKRKSKET